mmetsp:Transcript_47425/g.53637  ORF Transcript_47425/g.53637 Transcript_47425/m.53637 type:complete len:154 (+) Transcript_47425:268-729(+)
MMILSVLTTTTALAFFYSFLFVPVPPVFSFSPRCLDTTRSRTSTTYAFFIHSDIIINISVKSINGTIHINVDRINIICGNNSRSRRGVTPLDSRTDAGTTVIISSISEHNNNSIFPPPPQAAATTTTTIPLQESTSVTETKISAHVGPLGLDL